MQPGFTYSACGRFTRNKERIVKFLQTGNIDFIYKSDLEKTCFQHDMLYGKSKDLTRRTQSDEVLRDKAFKTAIDPKDDGCQRGLASMAHRFLDRKSSGRDVDAEPNYLLANELHRQIIRKFKRRKVCSSFRDNIWSADLADMQSINKSIEGIKYVLCAINLFSKYAWVVPLDNTGISIANAFQKAISKVGEAESEERRKPNKIWADQGGELYNKLFKRFLKINNIEMYSTYNEEISVVAERFIRTLKNKIFKHMAAVSKNVYFDVLDNIFNKYNNTVHRTTKMKPIDVASDSYAEYNEDSNEKNAKFKVGDCVRISRYINIFDKGCTQNWPEEIFVVRNTVLWTYLISNLNGAPITETFYEKELSKTSQEKFRIEKVIKKKGDKL